MLARSRARPKVAKVPRCGHTRVADAIDRCIVVFVGLQSGRRTHAEDTVNSPGRNAC